MKNILLAFFLAFLTIVLLTFKVTNVRAQVYVPEHTTKSGRLVKGHYRKQSSTKIPGDITSFPEHTNKKGNRVARHEEVTTSDWVPPHTTKKGNEVPGHYRKKRSN